MDQPRHVASRHRSNNTRRLKTTIDEGTHRLGILHPNIGTISDIFL